MNWKTKSLVQRLCASAPFGGALYFQLQTSLGGLRDYDYAARFTQQLGLARRLARHGVGIEGAEVFEVGTGWVPLIPIGFWLCGAARVRTFDLHRHLSLPQLGKAIEWISANRTLITDLYDCVVERNVIEAKLDVARRLRKNPARLMDEARIEYTAPGDAARTGLAEGTVDIHVSTSVFEHIPADVLGEILAEAHRMLRPGGAALHLVDPTDHFAHGDRSITLINFLRFDSEQWRGYADNRFAYHNRLLDRDYRALFEKSPLELAEAEFSTDERSRRALEDGFPLAQAYAGLDPGELCRTDLYYLAFKE